MPRNNIVRNMENLCEQRYSSITYPIATCPSAVEIRKKPMISLTLVGVDRLRTFPYYDAHVM
jgi:hypothetical protein